MRQIALRRTHSDDASIYSEIEEATAAFIGLFHGENFGKAVVRVGPDRA